MPQLSGKIARGDTESLRVICLLKIKYTIKQLKQKNTITNCLFYSLQ